MKRLVVLSGAGISAESGLKTFRDGDGLWEGHDIQQVATPEAWRANPELVQRFYNERRAGVLAAEPNAAHKALVELEQHFHVTIITQNIDNLHERAGSTHVLHLHGEITKSQGTADPSLVYDVDGAEIAMGDTCALGSQLRPFIVWFGEAVPMMVPALEVTSKADILLVVGTSLVVYPAAGLVTEVGPDVPIYVIDPKLTALPQRGNRKVTYVNKSATVGVLEVVSELTK